MNLFPFLNGMATFLAQNNQKHLCNPRGLFPWVLTSGRWPKSVKRLFDSAKLPRDYKGYVSNVTDTVIFFFYWLVSETSPTGLLLRRRQDRRQFWATRSCGGQAVLAVELDLSEEGD